MKLATKSVKVLQLTHGEMESVMNCFSEARAKGISSLTRTGPQNYFQVEIVKEPEHPMPKGLSREESERLGFSKKV